MNPQAAANDLLQQHSRTYTLYWNLKEELHSFLEAIKTQSRVDVAGHPFFSRISEVVEDFSRHGDEWLSFVFGHSRRVYVNHPLIEHSVNVGILALAIAERLGLRPPERAMLAACGFLHEAGMLLLPKEILSADRPLSDQERDEVEWHPWLGYMLLRDAGLKHILAETTLQEQERSDGTGYPNKASGKDIALSARIIGLCDSVESLTHPRPYRPAGCFEHAFERLMQEGISRFPRAVWLSLLRRLTPYPPGTLVRLSNGGRARVKRVNPYLPFSPTVERVLGPGRSIDSPAPARTRLMDLALFRTVRIEASVRECRASA